MKKLLLILLYFVAVSAIQAQDKIITTGKDTIHCRILSVGEERIIYEQKVDETRNLGKSIALDEVFLYFRTEQPGGLNPANLYKVSRPKPEHRYLFTLQAGLAHSFTDYGSFNNFMSGAGVPAEEVDRYTGGLKNGYHVNAGFHYLVTSFMGIGADYSLFYSAADGDFLLPGYGLMNVPLYVNVAENEKNFIQFAGPSVLFRQTPNRKGKLKVTESLSPGIVLFRNESRGYDYQMYYDDSPVHYGMPPQYYDHANSVAKSTTFGVRAGISLEYSIHPQLTAGAAGNFIWSELNKVSVKSSSGSSDNELEKAINVSHLNYGFTFRYNF